MSELRPRRSQIIDASGNPEVLDDMFFGVFGQDPVLNPINIFSDEAETIALANPQATNSRGLTINRVFASVDFSYEIRTADDAPVEGPFDVRLSSRAGFDTADALTIITLTETSANLYNADEGFVSLPPTGIYALNFPTTNTGDVNMTFTGLAGTFDVLDEGGQELGPAFIDPLVPRLYFWDGTEWKRVSVGELEIPDIQFFTS